MDSGFWRGKRVFLTGHTGFKGSWLALWLSRLGAEVHGYSLAPPTDPSLFELAGIRECLASHRTGDIRVGVRLQAAIRDSRPEIVFHLAAQPLVRASYAEPLETLDTNVMGTASLLEAVRGTDSVRAIVVVTSDKCYMNREWYWPYREDEPLGGHDPYSASKAAAEIVAAAYRASFLAESGCALATARAGNVIGGGDFAEDRLLPDILRAFDAGRTLHLRSPRAVRPWQHVLEPLRGYLMLAQGLCESGADLAEGWNFGPWEQEARSVRWITEYLAGRLPGLRWSAGEHTGPHEATLLRLDSSKARARLGWLPAWSLEQALDRTVEWHLAWRAGDDLAALMDEQLVQYEADACGA